MLYYKYNTLKFDTTKVGVDVIAYEDGGIMAKGGIFSKRDLGRDRMFKSQQSWEQKYKRKAKPRNPHYKH